MGGAATFVPARPEDLATAQPTPPAQPAAPGFVPARPEDLAAAAPAPPAPPAAPPAPQKPMWQRAVEGTNQFLGDVTGQNANMDVATGFGKGMEKSGAGLVELLDKYGGLAKPDPSDVIEYQKEHPGSTTEQALAAVSDPTNPYRGPTSLHAHATAMTVANWLRKNTETHGMEKVGDFGEGIWELLGTMGLGEVPGAAADTMKLSEYLSNVQKAVKAYETPGAISRLMRTGVAATKAAAKAGFRGAAEQGAQTFVKTGGDTEQTKEAGIIGGATGAIVGGGLNLYKAGREALNEYIEKIRPQTREISNVETPILASQNRNAPPAAVDAATIQEAPEYRNKQQTAAANITKNEAQNAVRKSLRELNAGRVVPTIKDPARILSAPADAKPYKFHIDLSGDEPTPTREGTTGFDPGKQQIGTRVVEGKGPATFNLRGYSPELADAADAEELQRVNAERAAAGQEPLTQLETPEQGPQQGSHREPIYQYRTSVKPDQQAAASRGIIEGIQGGRGTMTFEGPEQAVAGINQFDNIINSPNFSRLEDAQQARIQNARDSLKRQLDDFNAYRIKNPHFGSADAHAAAEHTGDFSQGADQLEQAVQPVYDKLDEVSKGEWGSLRKIEQNMRRIVRAPTTPEAFDAASRRLDEVTSQQGKILTDNKESISQEEWRAANRVWRDASTMRDIHDSLEQSYNGVDADIAAATKGDKGGGIPRIMTGSDAGFRRLQALRQTRPDDVKRVLGNGYTNLYRMTDLLKDPADATASKGLMRQVGMVLRRYGKGLGLGAGGVVGAALGHGAAGAGGHISGFAGGAMAGAATEAYIRNTVFRIATNPEIADRFVYAVKNRVPPRVAATLIASMITKSFDMQEKQPSADNQRNPQQP